MVHTDSPHPPARTRLPPPQAALTNFGSYDPEEVRAEIASTVASAPVVVYTYGLSPFSSEVVAILESTG